MKVLLLFPQTETPYGLPNYPPLGIAYIAGMLKRKGIEYNVLDLRLYDDWKERLTEELKKNYGLVGITSTTFDFDSVKILARIIKENSNSKIMIGGAHPTLMREKLLRDNPQLDFLIIHEGEHTMIELAYALDKGKSLDKIKGLCHRKGKKAICNETRPFNENLDELPFPEYEKFDLKRYHGDTSLRGILKRTTIMPLLTSRGCPFGCVYCSVHVTTGRKFRARSPENIIGEMKILTGKYKAGIIDFLDDCFTLDIDRAKKICRLIIDEKLNVQWGIPNGIRVDRIDEELARLMKKSGCNGVALGIESVDDEVLKKLKKGISIAKIEEAIRVLKKYKVPIKGFFLVGSPGGSKEEVLRALRFAKEHKLEEARFSMLVPYPATELFEWATKNKYWTVKNPMEAVTHSADTGVGYVKALYETPEFTAEDKSRVYDYVMTQWDRVEMNWKRKFAKNLSKVPFLYKAAKKARNLLKR